MADAADSNRDKDQKPAEPSADHDEATGTALVVAAGETISAGATTAAPSWFARMRAFAAAAIPSSRTALAAGGIGMIAGAGLIAGAIGLMGIEHLVAAPKPVSAPVPVVSAETRALKQAVGKIETQIAALKATVDASTRRANSQRAQITERYERTARLQDEMQTRLAKIGDTVERLDKRVAAVVAADVTGSVAPRYVATAAAQQPAAAETKTPAAEEKAAPEPPVASGWVIRDIFRGRALVVSRRGVFEAAPGLHLPGLGRVEAITRKDGDWVVVTEKGVIKEMRRPRSAYGRH